MGTYYFNGEKYYFKNGRWMDEFYMSVPLSVVEDLNDMLVDPTELEDNDEFLLGVINHAKISRISKLAVNY